MNDILKDLKGKKMTPAKRSSKTRANTAQTHGPPRSIYIYFLLHKLAEYAVHPLRRCQAGTCLFSSVQLEVGQSPPNGCRQDHGPTNVRAMLKTIKDIAEVVEKKYHSVVQEPNK